MDEAFRPTAMRPFENTRCLMIAAPHQSVQTLSLHLPWHAAPTYVTVEYADGSRERYRVPTWEEASVPDPATPK